MAKKRGLGKGLDALLTTESVAVEHERSVSSSINELELSSITPNPYQPRRDFDEESLEELADSIKSLGLVQPITVRTISENRYEIIAGERRFRAAKMAGLETIPAYIRETEDDNILALALIENIQREDLNAMEVAFSYKRLMDECKLTQEELSSVVGKKRATISNYVRLLNLPAEIQLAVRNGQLSMGHARALLALRDAESQLEIFEQIKSYDLSVRRVEEIIQALESGVSEHPEEEGEDEAKKEKHRRSAPKRDLGEYAVLQDRLRECFNSKAVLVRNANGKGRIVLPFASDEELEGLMALLDKNYNH